MSKFVLTILLLLSLSVGSAVAGPPTYPILLEKLPNQPNLTVTFKLTDGTTLKDVMILSRNEDSDPGDIQLRFLRANLKSSIYLKDLVSMEFIKVSGEKGVDSGDPLKISLKNGKSGTIEYLSGLDDGFTIVYKDDFSGYYQKLYIPTYKKVSDKSDEKTLYVKQIFFKQG